MLTRQSTLHGKYHRNTGYLLRNVDAGTQEFVGTGYHVGDGQMRQTDGLQMMMSRWSCTSQSHKRITQTNHANKMMSRPRMEMMNEAFRCSRATQVHMEDLKLVNLTAIRPSRMLQSSLLMLWMDENASQQSNKNCWQR